MVVHSDNKSGARMRTFVGHINFTSLADDLRDVFCLLDSGGDELFELSELSINVHE